MSYTLAEAAAACGLDKSTVRRAVRSGRISGIRDELGVWHIEPCELHRVFEPVVRTEGDTTAMPRDAPPAAAAVTTDALVAELRSVIVDLRQEKDRWHTAFEREQAAHAATQRLLPAPIEQDATPTATPRNRLQRAWRWMRASA